VPRASAQKFLHFAFSVFSAHYVYGCCGPTGFQKSRWGYLTIMHTDAHIPLTISSCVAPINTVAASILRPFPCTIFLTSGRCISELTDFFCLSKQGGIDWMDVRCLKGWDTLLADFFSLSFFAHNDSRLPDSITRRIIKTYGAAGFSARHPELCN